VCPRISALQVQTVINVPLPYPIGISRLTRVFHLKKSPIGTAPRKKKPLVLASVLERLSPKSKQRIDTRLIPKNRLVIRSLPQLTGE